MAKVREHLLSLGPPFKDAKTVPIMVKAYANLHGLAQACVRNMKLGFVGEMVQFWLGFSRSSPLVDFVDVGPGREEADNKLRGKWSLTRVERNTQLTTRYRSAGFPY